MFKDMFNEDNKSICVVTNVTDGEQKVVGLGKDFDNYFDKTYGKAVKDLNTTEKTYEGMRKATIYLGLACTSAFLLQRKLKKRIERQYKDICSDMFNDHAMDEFVMKVFEEQFGNDDKENL